MAITNKKKSSEKGLYVLVGSFLLLVSILVRISLYNIVSADFSASIIHWFQTLSSSSGLSAFAYPFANYPPLYLYLLKILTFIPVNSLYSIKTLSVIFDAALSIAAVLIIKKVTGQRYENSQLFLSGVIMFSIPTVVLNSSLWAQCDVIYSFFILLSIYYVIMDKPLQSVLFFSIAISLKLQAIFFLPVLVGYLLSKKYGIYWIIIIPVIFVITIVPAWIGGGNFFTWFEIYAKQSSEFSQLSLAAPSIFAFINDNGVSNVTDFILSGLGIAFAGIASLYISYLTFKSTNNEHRSQNILFLSIFSCVIIPFFLPHMHERYFYLADVISVIYAYYYPRRWHIPFIIVISSLFSYFPFLSSSIPLLAKFIVQEGMLAFFMLIVSINLTIISFKMTGLGEKLRLSQLKRFQNKN